MTRQLAILLLGAVATFFACIIFARADDFADRFNGKVQCPTPGETCKVLILSPTEERMLMGTNGILDTAAQARSLDLGQFSVYLKTRIASAPAGDVKPTVQPNPQPVPVPATPTENKPAPPVDNPK